MCIVAGTSVINMYFSKNRGKANALSRCFLAVGALSMTQLLSALFDEYGFTGTLMTVGAVALNLIPASMLLRPLDKLGKTKNCQEKPKTEEFNFEPEKVVCHIENGAQCQEKLLAKDGTGNAIKAKQDVIVTTGSDIPESAFKDKRSKPGTCMRALNCFWLAVIKTASVLGLTTFKNIKFTFLTILMTSYCLVNSTNMSLLAGLAIEKGYLKSQVTLLMTLNFATEIPFRLLSGVLIDLKFVRTRRLVVFACLSMVIGVLIACQPIFPVLIPSIVMWMLTNGLMSKFLNPFTVCLRLASVSDDYSHSLIVIKFTNVSSKRVGMPPGTQHS